MAYLYALDILTPAGTEAAALGDDRVREFKSAIRERINSRFVDVDADPLVMKSPASGGNVQTLTPITDNTYNLGTAALRFADLRAVTATIGTMVLSGGAGVASLTLPALGKLYIDGGTDTYIDEEAANTIRIVVGTNRAFTIAPTAVSVGANMDLVITAAKRLYLDSGGDTYIHEAAANSVLVVVGGSTSATFFAGGFAVEPTDGVYFDNGANTYIYEAAADDLRLIVGGVIGAKLTASLFSVGASGTVWAFAVHPTGRIYVDGGGDSYIYEQGANRIDIVVGGATRFGVQSASVFVNAADLLIDTTKKLYFDSGADTYLSEVSANRLDQFAGGVKGMTWTATYAQSSLDFIIDPTKKLFFDGGSDSYIYEAASNDLKVFSGGNQLLRLLWSTTAGDVKHWLTNPGTTVTSANTNLAGDGGITIASSLRALKKEIKTLELEDARRMIFGLRPVRFKAVYEKKGPEYLGLIAEEVEKVDRRLAMYYDGDLQSVTYDRLAIPMLSVLQDHEARLQKAGL